MIATVRNAAMLPNSRIFGRRATNDGGLTAIAPINAAATPTCSVEYLETSPKVAEAAEREPILMCVDDAHWVDGESLRFFLHLASRLEQIPVLLVIALRPACSRGRPRVACAARDGPRLGGAPAGAVRDRGG